MDCGLVDSGRGGVAFSLWTGASYCSVINFDIFPFGLKVLYLHESLVLSLDNYYGQVAVPSLWERGSHYNRSPVLDVNALFIFRTKVQHKTIRKVNLIVKLTEMEKHWGSLILTYR